VGVPRVDRAIFTDILDFCARVLAIQGGKGRSLNSPSDPDTVLPLYSSDRARSGSPSARLEHTSARGPWSERWSAWGHAAALSDGHVSQDADRFASTRACRFIKVHLVRRLSSKRRMRKHAVVFVDVERHESTDSADAVEGVENEPLDVQDLLPEFRLRQVGPPD
jgi:hypothetical protein